MPPAPITGSPMNAATRSPCSARNRARSAGSSCETEATSGMRVPNPSRLDGIPARLVPYAFMPW